MPKTEKELAARDARRNLGEELLESIRQIKAGQVGRVTVVELSPAAEARLKLGLSQAEFAKLLGVSKRVVQDWEQRRRNPSGAAKTLIRVAMAHPEVVREAALV